MRFNRMGKLGVAISQLQVRLARGWMRSLHRRLSLFLRSPAEIGVVAFQCSPPITRLQRVDFRCISLRCFALSNLD